MLLTDTLSSVQFGDLHIRNRTDENYQDFLSLIAEANKHLAGAVDFAFLPGDNADDGTEEQHKLVREALGGLKIPVHSITGDHDRKGGELAFFQQYLEPVSIGLSICMASDFCFSMQWMGPIRKVSILVPSSSRG